MKKSILIIVMMIVLALSLAACTNPAPADAGNDEQSGDLTMLEEGVWPVNQYTDGLPVPAGTVAWAMLDTEHGNCSISTVGITETECEEYLALLKQKGFSLVAETSEAVPGQDYVSIGTLLSNGQKALSISYIPGSLTLYISFEK